MNSLARVFGNFREYCWVNQPSTTIDIVVVREANGEYCSTPLHVCMDIPVLLKDDYYKFDIKINGKQKDIHLCYKETDEACLLDEFTGKDEEDLAASETIEEMNEGEEIESMAEMKLISNCGGYRMKRSTSLPSMEKEPTLFIRASSENFLCRTLNDKIFIEKLNHLKSLQSDFSEISSNLIDSKKNFRSDGYISDPMDQDEGQVQKDDDGNASYDQIFEQKQNSNGERDESSQMKRVKYKKSSSINWLLRALLNIIKISSLSKAKSLNESSKIQSSRAKYNGVDAKKRISEDVASEVSNNSFSRQVGSHLDPIGDCRSFIDKLEDYSTKTNLNETAKNETVSLGDVQSWKDFCLETQIPILKANESSPDKISIKDSLKYLNDDSSLTIADSFSYFDSTLEPSKYFGSNHLSDIENTPFFQRNLDSFQSCQCLEQPRLSDNILILDPSTNFASNDFSFSCETESFDEHKFLKGLLSSEIDLSSLATRQTLVSDSRTCQSSCREAEIYPDDHDFTSSTLVNGFRKGHLEDDLQDSVGTVSSGIPEEITESNVLAKESDTIALSLCGFEKNNEVCEKRFQEKLLSFEELCMKPELFFSPKLVVSIKGQYFPWKTAAPLIALHALSGKEPTRQTVDRLRKLTAGRSKTRNKFENFSKRNWWLWRIKSNLKSKKSQTLPEIKESVKPRCRENELKKRKIPFKSKEMPKNLTDSLKDFETLKFSSLLRESNDSKTNIEAKSEETYTYSYARMFKFSSNVLKKFDLREGKNLLEFSVYTPRGSYSYRCFIYLWSCQDKIIVSDIDGTITKSDVLGHILPMVGKDWSQTGVAPLFNKIVQNGYRMLYVSSRGWNQVKATRDYINWVRQDNIALPDGPILLSPDSIFDTCNREMIEKRPEVFKTACLSEILNLFPDKNPFYAAYGNRINDAIAYQNVGIPESRIFTVNHKGEIGFLTHSLRSSYSNMISIVDFIFSPYQKHNDDSNVHTFMQNIYWRDPIYEMPFSEKGHRLVSSSSRSFKFLFPTNK